jgi:hypothetical protein
VLGDGGDGIASTLTCNSILLVGELLLELLDSPAKFMLAFKSLGVSCDLW